MVGSEGQMTGRRWRFSLRDLFLVITLFATAVAMTVNYPGIAVFVLGITSPFLFAAAMAFFNNRVRILAGATLFLISAALIVVAILVTERY